MSVLLVEVQGRCVQPKVVFLGRKQLFLRFREHELVEHVTSSISNEFEMEVGGIGANY
jgi:hypothetical protein